jgi:hypothetical protein
MESGLDDERASARGARGASTARLLVGYVLFLSLPPSLYFTTPAA